MGNLTNQYVSQSYQGLLKLDNSNTGVTATLQYVTDGLGNKIPMLASTSSVVITGSFRGDGSGLTGITVDSGSLVTTSSFNSYTSSNDNRVNSLISATGSYATTSSLTALSQSIASTDLAQNNRLTSIEGVTGSFASTSSLNSYTLTSSFNAYTSSTNGRLNSLESATASLQNQINQKLDTGSFNAYTSSNDAKVNSLIAATASYVTETESGSFLITGSASGNVLTFTKGNGTQFNLSVDTGSNSNRNGLITTGSAGLTQQITGSLNVEGTISATSASFTYVTTVFETASVIYSSGSNQFGDASNDTQTLWGTVVLPSGPLVITGSVTASAGFNGNLQGTASFASNALSASQAQNAVSASQSQNSVSASQAQNANTASYVLNAVSSSYSDFAVSSSQAQNAVSASQAQNAVTASYANDINRTGLITTGSAAAAQSITGSVILSGSAGIELDVKGDQTNTGSVNISGSLNVNGPVSLLPGTGLSTSPGLVLGGNTSNKLWVSGSNNDVYLRSIADIILTAGNNGNLKISGPGGSTPISASIVGNVDLTGSMNIRNGNFEIISNNTTLNPDFYLTSSQAGQVNMVFGWNDNPASTGPTAVQANYTGSLAITGSNNIVNLPQIRATLFAGPTGTDLQGYISGSGNWINSNQAGIYLNTGSLLFPKTQNNILGNGSAILMNFTTSSLAGGHPIISNNLLLGGALTFNGNSGSVTAASNALLGGGITSNQNFVTNTRPTISTNNVIGQVTLNHLSSSINYQNNYNNALVTINNAVSSSITNNSLTVGNNAFFGSTTSIFASGSQSSNATRNITNNLIGGINNVVSSSFVSSSNSNLVASLIVGNGLNTFATHTAGTNGGSAFLGRFNDNNFADTQNIVFAVGTGTAAGTRRTGLYVTSGSLVGVSGSFDIKGNSTITGSVNIVGQTFMSSSTAGDALVVDGTFRSKRASFIGNPFNNNGSGTFGSLNYDANNITLQYLNNDILNASTQSAVYLTTDTGSNYTQVRNQASYAGTNTSLSVSNFNGTRNVEVQTDTMTVTGSLGISNLATSTGSFVVTTDNNGLLTKAPFSQVAAVLFSQGQFAQTGTLTASAGVSSSVSYDISGSVNGVTLVSGSRLTIPTAGVYNIQFSAQWDCASGADSGYAWFKKNGVNIANSNTKVTMPNNTSQVMTVNILETAAVGDYYEVAWQNDGSHARLLGAAATGNLPAIPSVITTITQVR